MNTSIKKSTFVVIAIGLVGLLITSFCVKSDLTQEQAVHLAEQFVIDNGYTNLPADKSKLIFELFDETNVDTLIIHRHNILQPKAFCISEDKDKWDVGFLYVNIDIKKLDSVQLQTDLPGRAVIVMKNGKEIRMAHKQPLFSRFKKL
jgi:hypothetical protein